MSKRVGNNVRGASLFYSPHLIIVELQLVDFVEESLDVSHSQQLGDERLDFKLFQVIDVFSRSDEDHRRFRRRHTRKLRKRRIG